VGGQKTVYIKDAYHSEDLKKELLAVSSPILDGKTGEFLGVIAARVDLTNLNKIVTEDTGFGRTEELFVINKYGYMITPSRFLKDTFLKQKVDTENSRSCFKYRDKGGACNVKHYMIISPDYRGVMIAGSNAYIPEMQWSLLSNINTDEALEPLRKITALFLIILLGAPVAAWLFGLFLSSIITGPIRRLHRGAEIIGEGNLNYKVGTDSKDEIGQLSRAFDKMTGDLKNTTTSIDNLNKEIARRKEVEKKLAENAGNKS
jgi:methyl-accepting chemotaxis protein